MEFPEAPVRMARQRRTVRYSGQVQGVGFRYTAARVAVGCEVAGYVRNVPDGSVELVAEGEPAELDAFLEDIRRRMAPYIENERQTVSPATGEFGEFTIRA
jgi:acylphosphatase